MKNHTKLGVIALLGMSLDAHSTQVNVNHLAPFADTANGTAVSVNVNDAEVLTGVTYLQSSGYIELAETGVAPGDTKLDVFTPPGGTEPAISATVNLAADTFYSVTAIGDGKNQPLELLPLVDSQMTPADGNFMLRIIHAAPFSAAIDDTAVSIRTDVGDVVNGLESVLYKQDSGFFELPAGTYDLNVSSVDGRTRLLDIAPVDFAAGSTVNVYAVGDGTNQPLNAYAVFGDGSFALLDLELTPPEPTRVNVAHLAPFAEDITTTAVSVNLDGGEILNGVQYLQSSGYLTLAEDGSAPGMTQIELFAPAGSDTAVNTLNVDLAEETDYTVIAIGDGINQPIELLPLVDDNTAPGDGNVKIRVVHSAPFAEALMDTAVSIRTDEGDVVNNLSNVEFGMNSGFFEIPAGEYDLNISTPDGSNVLIDIAPVNLNSGDVVTLYAVGEGSNQPLGVLAIFADGNSLSLPLEVPFERLNAALSGAWHNPETSGQGIMVEVYPNINRVHGAWFTYDTTFADVDEMAVVGDPNHRWYTLEGPYTDRTASLDVVLTQGGIFDDNVAVTRSDGGNATLVFDSCSTATLSYVLDGSGLTGTIPLQRINGDNVALCESLSIAED